MTIDRERLKAHIRELLTILGQNPDEPGLKETPRRVADFWVEFLEHDPGEVGTTFEAVTIDQLVVVKGLRVWSLCEHHLLPFWADIAIGYIPDKRVLGLSKFGRIAKMMARKLQLQERLVAEICGYVGGIAQCADVAVIAEGQHLCMEMRGAEMGHRMVSSEMQGRFRTDAALRAEFLRLTGQPA